MASAAVSEIMDYPMKIDSEGSLICDMSKLENHLIQQQNSEQQNYSQHDVTELTVFLTKHRNPTSKPGYRDIRVLLDNHTANDVTLLAPAVFYINPEELVIHHHHILRMILQCLSSEDRVRLLRTELSAWCTLLHLIVSNDKTGETMKTVLELVSENQYHHLLSVRDKYKRTPLHWVCETNNSTAILEVIMRLVTSEQTRYELLQIPALIGPIPLHYAAHRNATQTIRIICDSVSSHLLIKLLTTTGGYLGQTPVQRAKQHGKQEAEKLLQSYHTTANLIVIALQQTDHTGK